MTTAIETPKKAGRPKIVLSEAEWQDIDQMMLAHSSGNSIANKLQISYDTLAKRIFERYKTDFSDILAQKRAAGDDLLKQRAFNLALSSEPGSVPTLIFLLKARAGYSEKPTEADEYIPAVIVMDETPPPEACLKCKNNPQPYMGLASNPIS